MTAAAAGAAIQGQASATAVRPRHRWPVAGATGQHPGAPAQRQRRPGPAGVLLQWSKSSSRMVARDAPMSRPVRVAFAVGGHGSGSTPGDATARYGGKTSTFIGFDRARRRCKGGPTCPPVVIVLTGDVASGSKSVHGTVRNRAPAPEFDIRQVAVGPPASHRRPTRPRLARCGRAVTRCRFVQPDRARVSADSRPGSGRRPELAGAGGRAPRRERDAVAGPPKNAGVRLTGCRKSAAPPTEKLRRSISRRSGRQPAPPCDHAGCRVASMPNLTGGLAQRPGAASGSV